MMKLQCPHCGNKMKYQQQKAGLRGKRKQCVYCGRSFKVVDRIVSFHTNR